MHVHLVFRIALAVSFAALGRAEPYFNCPKGTYLSYKRRAIATLDLARQQREAISAGWQPHGNKDPNYGHTYERTGTSTWCSFNWARPNKCQHDSKPAMMPDEIWHQTLPSGMPGHPVRSVFNEKIEFIHNYKAASSAVAAFLACAYGREVDSSVFEASVFVVRDPIDRFISGVGEMLRRYVNDHCPPGPNGPVLCSHSTMRPAFTEMFSHETDFRGKRKEALEEAMKSTRWWPLARSKGVGAGVLAELLTAFIDDIQCCHSSYAMDHFSAQSVFAATYATRGIDVVIKASNLEAGLQQLTQRVPSTAPPGQCKLSRQINSAATNTGENLPSSSALRAALTGDHIRELCKIYAQDFTCFDLPLPTECPPRDFSGMAPLPPAPPSPPPPPTAMHTPPPPSPTFNMPPLPPLLEQSIAGGDYYQPPPPPPLITSPYPFLAGLNPFNGQETLARAGSVAVLVLLILALLARSLFRVVRERREAALKGLAAKRIRMSKRRVGKAASTRGNVSHNECTAIQVVVSDDDVYSGRAARGQNHRSSRSSQSRSKSRRAYSAVGAGRRSRELLPSHASEDDGYDSSSMSAEEGRSRKHRHERPAAPARRARQAASLRASPPRRSKEGFPKQNRYAESESEEEY